MHAPLFPFPTTTLVPDDRLLVLAPHPDDESLATGGLIQRAVASGAKVRVVFVTDGDNNPWPQRFLERRWSIGSEGRQRWGHRRRREALAALQRLGVSEENVRFLGWPDQGSTAALLRGETESIRVLADEIDDWQPTLLVSPSLHDVHPDHNALAVQLRLALTTTTHQPQHLHYIVHRPANLPRSRVLLRLSESELAAKRDAILCHETQMALSRGRFLAYAKDTEQFFSQDGTPVNHPLQWIGIDAGALCLRVRAGQLRRGRLQVVFESLVEDHVRWTVDLPRRSSRAVIRDAATGVRLRHATARASATGLEVRLPLAPILGVARVFVKYDRSLAFYDLAGWREIPIAVPAPAPCPALPFSETSPSSPSFAPSSFGGVSAHSD